MNQLALDFDDDTATLPGERFAPPVAQPPRAPPGLRAIRLGPRLVTYRFRRAHRRTIGLSIDREGLAAAAPRWVTLAEVEAFIREKKDWILRKLAETPLESPRRFEWRAGERLPYLDHAVTLTLDGTVRRATLIGERLHIPATAATGTEPGLRAAVLPWIREAGLVHFADRIACFAPLIEVPPPALALSNARTQWGSCTVGRDQRARIRLHWKLLLLPSHLGDYVVAHELAHVREMNHSARFWRVVEAMYPGYRGARQLLRNEAKLLPEL